jgi:ribosomal-protein-alanine N-acetyltransferase
MYAFMFEPGIVGLRIAVVAESGGMVIGFAVLTVIAPEAELDAIAVVAGFQRRGVARALLEAVVREAVNRGATDVLLEVRTSNLAARAFYRSMGFEERGSRKAYYSDPVEDAAQMGRCLLPNAGK